MRQVSYTSSILKLLLAGRKFKTDAEVIVEVQQYLDNLDTDDYKSGIMTLQHSWYEYINVEGN